MELLETMEVCLVPGFRPEISGRCLAIRFYYISGLFL